VPLRRRERTVRRSCITKKKHGVGELKRNRHGKKKKYAR